MLRLSGVTRVLPCPGAGQVVRLTPVLVSAADVLLIAARTRDSALEYGDPEVEGLTGHEEPVKPDPGSTVYLVLSNGKTIEVQGDFDTIYRAWTTALTHRGYLRARGEVQAQVEAKARAEGAGQFEGEQLF